MDKPHSVPAIAKYEAIGDWSGLKGSYYHLLYAVYLLLVKRRPVTFFAGNDLQRRIPAEMGDSDGLSLRSRARDHDEWIQVKNVAESRAWTVARILSDNRLLLNLTLNGLMSHFNGRSWTARLVTP